MRQQTRIHFLFHFMRPSLPKCCNYCAMYVRRMGELISTDARASVAADVPTGSQRPWGYAPIKERQIGKMYFYKSIIPSRLPPARFNNGINTALRQSISLPMGCLCQPLCMILWGSNATRKATSRDPSSSRGYKTSK